MLVGMANVTELNSRPLPESPHGAAQEQEELLGEEHPGDLLQRGPGLAPQVLDGGPQEGDAQAEAEEHAPVRHGLLPVALKERPDPSVHHHGVLKKRVT